MNKQHALVATLGRLLLATVFLVSGLGKIANPQMTQDFIASAGLPFPVLAIRANRFVPTSKASNPARGRGFNFSRPRTRQGTG
jgi:uncharacterized membrane protein YphA (DoxX/SURF4 family)